MKIGIYGGSFNPVHNSHLMLANFAKHELKLDKIFFIPSNVTPGKEGTLIDGRIRHDMIFNALIESDYLGFVSDYEINKPGISYTIDTIKFFKEHYPEDELFLICGPDVITNFHSWKNHIELEQLINVSIANRDFHCPDVMIRSTLIRDLIKKGYPISHLVPKSVEKFIDQHKLYQGENN